MADEIPFGLAKCRIVSHTVRDFGEKEAVSIRVQHPIGATIEALIWLTPKAMGMARAALKKCGFDSDTHDVQELVDNPTLLEGEEVEIIVQDYKGQRQASVNLRTAPSKKRLSEITKSLRDAKKSDADAAPPPSGDDIPF